MLEAVLVLPCQATLLEGTAEILPEGQDGGRAAQRPRRWPRLGQEDSGGWEGREGSLTRTPTSKVPVPAESKTWHNWAAGKAGLWATPEAPHFLPRLSLSPCKFLN